jgi:hypothetical protein
VIPHHETAGLHECVPEDMPDPEELALSEKELADLSTYLLNLPLR